MTLPLIEPEFFPCCPHCPSSGFHPEPGRHTVGCPDCLISLWMTNGFTGNADSVTSWVCGGFPPFSWEEV